MKVLLGADRERERDLLTRPLNWPYFPVLPVKRTPVGDGKSLGVIYWWHSQGIEEPGEGPIVVYLTNMRTFGHSEDNPARERYELLEYANLDAFFDDGWRGD